MDYKIRRSNRSLAIRISINARAEVVVSAPKLIPEFMIRQFVQTQQAWIETNLAKVKKTHLPIKNDEIYIFGKKYQVVSNHQANKIGIVVTGQQLTVNNLSLKSPAKIKQQLEEFLKKTAHKYIATRSAALAGQMGVAYQKITLREQSSRWGSCSSQGNLNFNWRLVHYPPAVIDYVIIHELAHRVEMNHSPKFWALVRQHDPEYQLHKGQLRRQRLH